MWEYKNCIEIIKREINNSLEASAIKALSTVLVEITKEYEEIVEWQQEEAIGAMGTNLTSEDAHCA